MGLGEGGHHHLPVRLSGVLVPSGHGPRCAPVLTWGDAEACACLIEGHIQAVGHSAGAADQSAGGRGSVRLRAVRPCHPMAACSVREPRSMVGEEWGRP